MLDNCDLVGPTIRRIVAQPAHIKSSHPACSTSVAVCAVVNFQVQELDMAVGHCNTAAIQKEFGIANTMTSTCSNYTFKHLSAIHL